MRLQINKKTLFCFMNQCTKVGVIVGTVLLAVVIAVVLFLVLQNVAKKSKQKTETPLGVDSNDVYNVVRDAFNSLIQFISTVDIRIPDLYQGCSGSTINQLQFCGNLKYSGTVEVGGSVACSIPYNTCRAGCTAACLPCHLIPFVSCKVPCTDCPNACKRAFEACSGATKAEWSVNVLEAFDIGNTFRVTSFDSFFLNKNDTNNEYDIGVTATVAASPLANVDIRTTANLGNYKGTVGLGNLKIKIPIAFTYNCTTKQTTLKKLDTLQIDGVNVQFRFSGMSDIIRKAIYSVAKGKIDSTIKDVLQDKLTSLFKDFIESDLLPRLQLNISC